MEEILNDPEKIVGHIYYIVNKTTCKGYVGQAVSHRKNHGRFRPFGYLGRFKDHISEAICNTKKKQCTYLNNAIRLYGADAFEVKLLHTCSKDDMDQWETHYIESLNSLYPSGYNLTRGGKTLYVATIDSTSELNPAGTRGGCKFRSDDTRALISKRLKEEFGKKEVREERMTRVQQQHYEKKLERFRGAVIDVKDLDQYIRIKHNNGIPVVVVRVGDKTANFVGKHEPKDTTIERAKEFLRTVAT